MIINFYEHPFQTSPPEVIEHHSIAEWLLERFGPVPTVTVQVFIGAPSMASEITHDIDALVYGSAPEYTVLQSPGAVIAGLSLAAKLLLGGAVLLGATYLLIPKTPSYGGGSAIQNQSRSSNNELGDRSNKVRILQRIEDIYGTDRSIPTLLMPSYKKYISNIQYEYSYLCVGRGYYSLSDVRDSETPLVDIAGARAAIYDPFTSPNGGTPVATIGDAIEDTVLTVKRSNEVDGLTLKALNQLTFTTIEAYDFLPAAVLATSGDVIRQNVKNPNFNAIVNVGDTITVTTGAIPYGVTSSSISAVEGDDSFNAPAIFGPLNLSPGSTIIVTGSASNNGTYTVATATTTKITVTGSLTNESAGPSDITITNPAAYDYSGNYEIAEVFDGYVVLTTTVFDVQIDDHDANVQVDGVTEWTNWVTLPQTDRAQVWLNLLALNGIYKDSGGGKALTEVEIEIEIEQVTAGVPTGLVETITETLSGATSDLRASTVEQMTAFTGPCRVRARRSTPYDYDFEGIVQDEIKLADLYSVSPVTALNFGNVTTIYTVTKATLRAIAAKDRQLNCLASRLLPTYDGTSLSGAFDETGLHVSGTIHATSRWIDILPAVSIDPFIGNRNIAELDMRQLWATHLAIEAWGSDYNQFNYTLDSDNLSYEDTVTMIADAVFCRPYRQNGLIRFNWQREQTSPNMPTFTHRNKRPDAETITRTFANDAEYDGVELVYRDPDTERAETIRLPLDGNYTKLKKIEVLGIRNFAQAWVRANREYNRLRYQRQSLDFEATADARLLLPGTRIDVVDDTRFKRYGGEVLGQNGLELILSQPVVFSTGAHSILLKQRDGSTQAITCTAGSSSNRVVLASPPTEDVVTTYTEDGIRTIYSFAADSLRDRQSWLAEEITPGEGDYMRIRAVNYAAEYWTGDTAAIPDKNDIIY